MPSQAAEPTDPEQGQSEGSSTASTQETCKGKHSQGQSKPDDGVSPGVSPRPTPEAVIKISFTKLEDKGEEKEQRELLTTSSV